MNSCARDTQVEDAIKRYRLAVENITSLSLHPAELDRAALAPPKRREIRIETPEGSINFREFFSLSGCQLNRLVGQHNSLLHIHQDAVENLFYELEFIHLAEDCLGDNQDSDDKIYLRLKSLSETKQKNIAASFFNALFASKEFQAFTSPYGALSNADNLLASANIPSTITFFDRIAADILYAKTGAPQDLSEQRANFDIALGELEKSQLAGKTAALLERYSLELDALNNVLEAASEITNRCNHDFVVLQQEFLAFYGKQNQAITAAVETLVIFEQLLRKMQPASDAYLQEYWLKRWGIKGSNRASTLEHFYRAYGRHLSLLKAHQDACDT